MSPRLKRGLKSLAAGTAGALIVALTVTAHVQLVNGESLTQGAYPASPALRVGWISLVFDALLPALILLPLLAFLAMLSGPWPLRLLSLLMFLSGWYWIAERVATLFAPHFGATWLPGEPFAELFYRWPATPAFMAGAALAYLVVLSRLNRA